eukprot:PhM_4_TR1909/c0_g1_i1/m.84664
MGCISSAFECNATIKGSLSVDSAAFFLLDCIRRRRIKKKRSSSRPGDGRARLTRRLVRLLVASILASSASSVAARSFSFAQLCFVTRALERWDRKAARVFFTSALMQYDEGRCYVAPPMTTTSTTAADLAVCLALLRYLRWWVPESSRVRSRVEVSMGRHIVAAHRHRYNNQQAWCAVRILERLVVCRRNRKCPIPSAAVRGFLDDFISKVLMKTDVMSCGKKSAATTSVSRAVPALMRLLVRYMPDWLHDDALRSLQPAVTSALSRSGRRRRRVVTLKRLVRLMRLLRCALKLYEKRGGPSSKRACSGFVSSFVCTLRCSMNERDHPKSCWWWAAASVQRRRWAAKRALRLLRRGRCRDSVVVSFLEEMAEGEGS